jgi:hypothetical protein
LPRKAAIGARIRRDAKHRILLAVITLVLVFVSFADMSVYENHISNRIRFYLYGAEYRKKAAERANLDVYDRVKVMWSQISNTWYGHECVSEIVFDPSDEISHASANVAAPRQSSWIKAMERVSHLDISASMDIFPLGDSFYSAHQCMN